MKGTSALDIPDELTESGGYEDSFKDFFGFDINISNLNDGYMKTAQDRILSMLNDNVGQPKRFPKFHSV